MKKVTILVFVLAVELIENGCSIRRVALKKVGDALASSGTVFASDDDPLLVRDAVPFSLKLMESILAESPKHRGLLLAAARSFTQYGWAFVQEEAEERETIDLAASTALRERARRLYVRARDYGLRGLETRHRGFSAALRKNPRAAAATITARDDVALLYWTAAAWGAAMAVTKAPELVADQPQMEALIDRALALDESFEAGAIHGFLISYEGSRQGAAGDSAARARTHFERAVKLTGGRLVSPFVAYVEAVSVAKQDRKQFEELLGRALAVDTDARPEWRLENIIMQRRARWLMQRTDELFVEGEPK